MQISLRAILILVALSAIFLAFWDSESRKQQSIANAIRNAEGRVTYSPAPTFVPNFILESTGNDYFCGIKGITLYPTTADECDKQLILLKKLPGLRSLAIWPGAKGLRTAPKDPPGGLTDEGLKFLLTHLRQLEHLSLLSARITPAAEQRLLAVEGIKSLQYDIHTSFGGGSGGR